MVRRIPLALLSALTFGVPALAGARQDAVVTLPRDEAARKARATLGYADAVVSGDTAYLSGVVAILREGETSPQPAYDRAFQAIADRLAVVGCGWDDVVELTSYHTDISAQLPFFVAAKRKYMREPYPAWTAVGVTRLIPNDGVTEIRVIARFCRPAARPAGS